MTDEAGREFVNLPAVSELTATSKPNQEPVRLMISGSRWGIKVIIYTLFQCGVAPVGAWSKLQQMPHSDRLMSVMTRYVQKPNGTENSNQADQSPKG